ncbi:MAG: hypothetical protein KatS3mg119_1888 [Rhodothalassiaceae bacterium]|nr:MAG: hypothetical protein KatS3mg119_1888 [Rhodothalassiaceae bacterium]
MAVYAQLQDLIDRVGAREITELTDRADPPAGAIDASVAERALADADAEIDGYLAARYDLPLSPVPAVLTRLATDIARYRLWDDRAPEEVRQRYEDAVRLLREIADGRHRLPVSAPQAAGAGPAWAAPGRVMPPAEF